MYYDWTEEKKIIVVYANKWAVLQSGSECPNHHEFKWHFTPWA